MNRITKKVSAAVGVLAVGAAGVTSALVLGNNDNGPTGNITTNTQGAKCSEGYYMHSDGYCYTFPGTGDTTTDPTGTGELHPGDTLEIVSTGYKSQESADKLVSSVQDLCSTTISGANYLTKWETLKNGIWFKVSQRLQLAQFQAPPAEQPVFVDTWNNEFMKTTVSGVKYCANKAKYAGGHWDVGMKKYQDEINLLRLVVPDEPATIRKK